MRPSLIVGSIAALIGVAIGNNLPRLTTNQPVSIVTFRINVPFDNWLKSFESSDARNMHRINKIKPIFKGFSETDPSQVIVIHQAKPGVIKKLISDNSDVIKASGHLIRTTRISNWLPE